jgi:hypothetical protein
MTRGLLMSLTSGVANTGPVLKATLCAKLRAQTKELAAFNREPSFNQTGQFC